MRSVTVRQLKLAQFHPDANAFILGRMPLHEVTLVGRITTINLTSATSGTFTFTDNTGLVTLKKMVNMSFPDVDERVMREEAEHLTYASVDILPYLDRYVCVVGFLTITDHGLTVEVTNIRAVNDFNEVTAHALQCIYEYCKSK